MKKCTFPHLASISMDQKSFWFDNLLDEELRYSSHLDQLAGGSQ